MRSERLSENPAPQPVFEGHAYTAELAVRREEYIIQAIEAVLKNDGEKVFRHPEHTFSLLVQNELIAKSGIDKQLGAGPGIQEAAKREYDEAEIEEKIFTYFGAPHGDYQALKIKLNQYLH